VTEIMTGFKFLDPSCCTYHNGKAYAYPVPVPGEKWGPWFKHPEPAEPDGDDCGPGGWHIMKRLNASYAPRNWWPWAAQGRGLVGESNQKARVHEVRIRRISRYVFWRALRLGWGKEANLRGADQSQPVESQPVGSQPAGSQPAGSQPAGSRPELCADGRRYWIGGLTWNKP